jgi:hypothetical protein
MALTRPNWPRQRGKGGMLNVFPVLQGGEHRRNDTSTVLPQRCINDLKRLIKMLNSEKFS